MVEFKKDRIAQPAHTGMHPHYDAFAMDAPAASTPAPPAAFPRSVTLLLNVAHALDHMFLLIFATAVAAIAADFGFARWEDLMPFGVAAFFLFGLASWPAGRLGDLWGRRRMMLLFFFGLGAAALLCALTRNAWQLAGAMALIGAFAAIYHPVGIPMIVQHATNPGAVIGVNGLAGNLGVALAALVTGVLVQWLGWRAAFAVPGLLSIACGLLFMRVCPAEDEPPARRKSRASVLLDPRQLARAFAVMTAAAVTGSLLFNFTTNGNAQLLDQRFRGIVEDPVALGAMLAFIYVVASLTQVVVGRLIDRVALKPLYLCMVLAQIPLLAWAAVAQGWALFAALLGTMVFIFGAIPFTDAMIVRYVDDRSRSRVAGMRLTVSFGVSSLAVWLLGPVVKQAGFGSLFAGMAVIAACTATMVLLLPSERPEPQSAPAA
ncbi:transporter, major facilitator family protein [Bordetella bronchiseptica B18-5 (C3)]|nr:transporter, major facilitator family protein [Bordetella bronchiseptica B18-5 (C3)]KDB93633.1 transporter, major facilitator family protein [Bordetella bronchiseptica D989]KDD27271.1 transporter, major facilitator family protein [Bordetella bronchiseptica MBORD782]KDD31287.1 transporter, major facilitator family protein [Bordetella bronchiseptica MBORD849]KDD41758.1 transporter, major facilitator family protein [Bordetella bronchiseptica MBORD901]KDD50474.1 transporter, major facilitator f